MNNATKLRELILANPDLPVMPMVSVGCVASIDSDYCCAELGDSQVEEYAIVELSDEKLYMTKKDLQYIEDCFIDEITEENSELRAEEVAKLAHEKVKDIEWTKAIIVYVERLKSEDE